MVDPAALDDEVLTAEAEEEEVRPDDRIDDERHDEENRLKPEYVREVEEALLRHPEIAEVSVIGRPHPEWGEVVVAYVVPSAGAPDPSALDAYCIDHMARFKRPKDYRFIGELPKNNYGKVLKTELRTMDASSLSNEAD